MYEHDRGAGTGDCNVRRVAQVEPPRPHGPMLAPTMRGGGGTQAASCPSGSIPAGALENSIASSSTEP
jgi:hypothetical protein